MKKNLLPIQFRLLIIINDGFFLFSLLYIPFIVIGNLNGDFEGIMNEVIFLMILWHLIALYRSLKAISIIENSSCIEQASYVGGLKYSDLNRNRGTFAESSRLFLQLTLAVPKVKGAKGYKHFYFVKQPLMGEKYNYFILRHDNKPKQVLLLNALPKSVQKYIMNWQSDK